MILTVTWQSLAFLPVSSSLGLSLWSLPSPLGSFQRSIFLRVYFLQNCYHLATCNKAEAANLFCCVKLEVEKIQSWGEPPPVTCCKFRHMERLCSCQTPKVCNAFQRGVFSATWQLTQGLSRVPVNLRDEGLSGKKVTPWGQGLPSTIPVYCDQQHGVARTAMLCAPQHC